MVPVVLCAVAVLTLSAEAKRQPGPIVSLSSSPSLFPAFNRGISDYVVRCRNTGLRLRAKATAPGTMRLDGRRIAAATLDRRLRRRAPDGATLTGRRDGHAVAYHVRCLPAHFPRWKVRGNGTPQADWYLSIPAPVFPRPSAYVTIFDRHGVPVWWMPTRASAINATLLPHARVAWSVRRLELLSSRSRPYQVHRLDGARVGTIVGRKMISDYHELRPLPNGDLLILGAKRRDHVNLVAYGGPRNATVLDGVAEELTRTGRVVWSWNSRGHIALSESRHWLPYILRSPIRMPDGRRAYDLVHLNSADQDGSTIVLSARHADAVYAVSRATGEVAWKLGGTRTPKSLALAESEPVEHLFDGQHDVRVLADGTLTAHDNRTQTAEPPQALRIRLDLARRQARVIERISAVPPLRSDYFGSARRLPGGNWVVAWGSSPRVAELTPSGKRVLELDFRFGFNAYRAVPIVRGQLSAAALRAGMDARAKRAHAKRAAASPPIE